jgi:hypothetical protein
MIEFDIKLRVVSILISVGFVLYVVAIVRKETLGVRDSLLWLVIGTGFFALALFPRLLDYITALMGIGIGVNALFLISSVVAFIILFQHSVSLSKTKESNMKLTQEIALLKAEIEGMAVDHKERSKDEHS